MKTFEPIADEYIDKIHQSLLNNPSEWKIDKDVCYNKNRVYISNWDQPESLVLKIGILSYSIHEKTITVDQAEKLSCLIVSREVLKQHNYLKHYMEKI